ncbi:glycosyltransferase family 39 protein [Fischerella thermalis]|uniref:glycosyltransferase family 39 protein n=1 Tax=Fischerella thermalis TaxID=372787 RepID=UPI000C808460|nr:phospholipid carrier-dependent glycosyltransferase [Fischerella thermalis]PLZ90436.1 glycosyltransferase [Fischerella thermalis CCMEE 5194]
MAAPAYPRWFHPCLLLVWLLIGMGLRLTNLTAKSPWTDEFSTLVFSLGNSFLPVPLNQPIAIDALLQPLQPQSGATIQDVLTHLFSESNHPPLYFVLTHLWLKLFPTQADLVSLWGARSLAAIFGAISIPAIYGLSWLAFRSRLVSHLAAAFMAISPYGIFLAQEARHYTLAILWVIASLACLVVATHHIQKRTQLPIWLVLAWIGINALGVATHYFFVLTLVTEAVVLTFLACQQWRPKNRSPRTQITNEDDINSPSPHHPTSFLSPPWKRIYAVAIGTLMAGIVWIPAFLHNAYGDKLTNWIQGDRIGIAWISPIFQAMAAWITMISLLPVESPEIPVVIASGLVMIIFFIWAIPILFNGFRTQLEKPQSRMITQVFAGVVVAAIALFFCFTYFLGIDLTRGARYNFVYFPAVVVLIGASLAISWNTLQEKIVRWGVTGKMSVIIIWVMGFLSAITVVCNLGYQKYYRPDLFVELIQNTSKVPVLIATTQKTHVQIGEMMGIAREFKLHNSLSPSAKFLLAHKDKKTNASNTLQNALKTLPRPFDLWLVNFHAAEPEAIKNCVSDTQTLPPVNGYKYKIYHCNS